MAVACLSVSISAAWIALATTMVCLGEAVLTHTRPFMPTQISKGRWLPSAASTAQSGAKSLATPR